MKLITFSLFAFFTFQLMAQEYRNFSKIHKASFSIPTASSQTSLAIWELSGVKWIQSNNSIKTTFYLPPELLGDDKEMIEIGGKLPKKSRFFKLKGAKATALCTQYDSKHTLCLIHFKNIKNKHAAAVKYLSETYKGDIRLNERKNLAQAFANDPIGTLNIRNE